MVWKLLIILILMNASIQKRIDISAFGMPVVDYVVYSDDTPELSTEIRSNLKYQMENSTKSNEILSKLYHSPKVHKTVGGSALNTLRMANFLIQKENNFYMGCIGKDLNGDLIKHTLKEEKIEFGFSESQVNSTSTAIVLIDKNEREPFVNIGSSRDLSTEHMKQFAHYLNNSKIIFTDAYLIHYLFPSYQYIFQTYSKNNNIVLSISLAAWEIITDYFDKVKEIIKYADLLFMNESEFDTLYKLMKFTPQNENEKIKEFVQFLSDKKENKNKTFVMVVTRGKADALLCIFDYSKNKAIIEYHPIIKIDRKLEIDKTGLGDSFAGGFLAGMILNKSYSECAVLGNIMSSKVIQLKGFQVPKLNVEDIKKELEQEYSNEKNNYLSSDL